MNIDRVTIDPMQMKKLIWPSVTFYDKQVETIYSVEDNKETYVPAANKMGKDFVTGFICACKFLRALKTGRTCRIVTTSVAEHHLSVLWAEIAKFMTLEKNGGLAAYPLMAKDGGPLTINHMEIRRASEADAKNPINYCVGRVSAKGEGLAGHHAQETLAVGDEASGIDDMSYKMFQGWAKRMLWIGNCNPTNNFFYRGVEAGDLLQTGVT